MNTGSSVIRPFFWLRLLSAGITLAGFWVCLARVDWTQGREASMNLLPPFQGTLESLPADGAGSHLPGNGHLPEPLLVLPETPPPVLMIDPGHGGADGGMVRNGLVEKDWTLKVGIALAAELKERGHRVELTRDTDTTVPLEQRPALVNAAPRTALLSIHFNAGSSDASGIETWYSWPKKPEIMARLHNADGIPIMGVIPDDSQRLALALQTAVTGKTGARDRGIKNREDLAMTSRTVCPAVLIECGFLSNGTESRKIQDAAYRRKLVRGLADGYEAWLTERKNLPVGLVIPATTVGTLPSLNSTATAGDAEH